MSGQQKFNFRQTSSYETKTTNKICSSQSKYPFEDVIDFSQFNDLAKQLYLPLEKRTKLCSDKQSIEDGLNKTTVFKASLEHQFEQWQKKQMQFKGTLKFKKTEIKRTIVIQSQDFSPSETHDQKLQCFETLLRSHEKKLKDLIDKQRFRIQESVIVQPGSQKQPTQSQKHSKSAQVDKKQTNTNAVFKESPQIGQKQAQFQRIENKCYKELILHPPLQHIRKAQHQISEKSTTQIDNVTICENRKDIWLDKDTEKQPEFHKQLKFRLKIDEILKIPEIDFLCFFSTNQRQILAFATATQMKSLRTRRAQILKKQEALNELSRKVAEQGKQLLQKLTTKQRQKLFKIFYEIKLSNIQQIQ